MNKVGRYEIQEIIGEGAMASVYKAFDPEINRTLAIKLLKPELAHQTEYRTRFVREAKGAGILSHPNIVTVYDVGGSEEEPYIAMELVEGRTLADVLRDNEPLLLKTVIEIGIQLAKALDYAHQRGIIHRDVKPGNIMLLKDGTTIKVADFGICRIEGGDATQETRVGDVLGTPNYMSPEQVLGRKVDWRSDIFSAGVVLYQLLTGSQPFKGSTLVSVALKIVKEEPVSIDKLRPDLPLGLRRVVDRCLKKAPEKRFQSGEEMVKELIAVLRDLPGAGQAKARRQISMGLRGALAMLIVVAATMSVTAFFIHLRQVEALKEQVVGYGASLAKFMATQTAEAVLGEDWVALEVFIQQTMNRQNFAYLEIVDRDGIVRGSSVAGRTGGMSSEHPSMTVNNEALGVSIRRMSFGEDQPVLDFMSPIQFHGRLIGAVRLGIYEAPLTEVARLTLLLLGILIAVTTITVAAASYLLAKRLDAPMQILRKSIEELGKGRLDYRIGSGRKDEFGQLFATFDATASALQNRYEHPDQPPAP